MSTEPHSLPWSAETPTLQIGRCDGARWARSVRLWRATGEPGDFVTADDEETTAIVLSGTFDLEANSSAWASRGTRRDPFAGRPVAVFLPPRTRFRARGAGGEIVLLAVRRPAAAAPSPPRFKPLLPMAGSNKAFDSTTGEWRPIESFADSPEAIQPRHIETGTVAGVCTQRILGLGHKAHALSAAEAVLAEGQQLTIPWEPSAGEHGTEWIAYWRTEGELRIGSIDSGSRHDGAVAGRDACTLTAVRGRAYVAIAHAGPKG